jgi:hypothetical protein
MAIIMPPYMKYNTADINVKALEEFNRFWSEMARCGSIIMPYACDKCSTIRMLRNILSRQTTWNLDIPHNASLGIVPSDQTDVWTERDGSL